MKSQITSNQFASEVSVYAIEGLRMVRKSMKAGVTLPTVMVIKDDCCEVMIKKMEVRMRKIIGYGLVPKLTFAKAA